MRNITILSFVLVFSMGLQCSNKPASSQELNTIEAQSAKAPLQVGADQLDILLPKLKGKAVGLVVNHTSLIGKTHLADTLKSSGVVIKKVFAPEHGFRGSAADGETIKDGFDTKTGLALISLYGSN